MSRGLRIGNKAGYPISKAEDLTLTSVTINPTSSEQVIRAPVGTAYNEVTINGVTSSIDSNLIPENVKSGVNILGITGTYGNDLRYVIKNAENGVLYPPSQLLDTTGIVLLNTYALAGAYYNSDIEGTISFPDLVTVNGSGLNSTFQSSTKITGALFPNVTTIKGSGMLSAFQDCINLVIVDLSKLATVGGGGLQYAFQGCTSLINVNFTSLKNITGATIFMQCFSGCTALENVYFNALKTNSFGSTYTNQFTDMLLNTGSDKIHTLHFPSNLESTISTLAGYPTFGGTSGYVTLLYDLPATS